MRFPELATVTVHGSWEACRAALGKRRTFAFSSQGSVGYASIAFSPDDVLVFGGETRGLPAEVLASFPPERTLRLPMRAGNRSLNLSNAVAVVVYEAWRQNGFA